MKTKYTSRPYVMIGSVVIALIIAVLFLKNYLVMIAIAAILAYLFNPVYQKSLKRFKGKKGLATSFTVVILFFTVTLPIAIIIGITINQTVEIVDQIKQLSVSSDSLNQTLNSLIDQTNKRLDTFPGLGPETLNLDQIIGWIKSGLSAALSAGLTFAKSIAGGVAVFFTNVIIFIFVFTSLLRNQKTILSAIENLNPLGKESNKMYMDKMASMSKAMIKGQFAIAFLQGLSGTISLWIVGVDYLAFWLVLLTFLSIIPLGGGIIIIPMGIIMILTGNWWQGLVLIGVHLIITTNIDNVLRPRFVPKNAQLDPALVILSVFAGIGVFGFVGIILGPIVMIVIVTAIQTYLDYKKQLYSKPETSKLKAKKA